MLDFVNLSKLATELAIVVAFLGFMLKAAIEFRKVVTEFREELRDLRKSSAADAAETRVVLRELCTAVGQLHGLVARVEKRADEDRNASGG